MDKEKRVVAFTYNVNLKTKWYPGCNGYPLGEDFDYENNKVKIIQEWITGAFSNLDEG